ncbi:MAG: HAD-IA family hydrolase [Spirochaetaceae bacterium]|jgi:putative hydrolase of the HAD superfamily|nr:HAD-IA family hydrolase [Spirochaetaceae bacterium]
MPFPPPPETPPAGSGPIEAVVFDLFFTLINPLGRDPEEANEYSILGMDREDFEARYTEDYETWGRGKLRDPGQIMTLTLRGLGFSPEKIRRAAEARMERIRRAIYGIEEKNLTLLRDLREEGYKTALVSNADVMDIRYWQGSALSRAFDVILFSCEEGLLKPDPRIFTLAAEKLRVESGTCLYVGDGGHQELTGARTAGMIPVLTTEYISRTWPEKIQTLRKDADQVIQSLDEIRRLVPYGPSPVRYGPGITARSTRSSGWSRCLW